MAAEFTCKESYGRRKIQLPSAINVSLHVVVELPLLRRLSTTESFCICP